MNEQDLERLLTTLATGKQSVAEVMAQLRCPTPEGACLDHYRPLRTGQPEVVFGATKTVSQLIDIMAALLQGVNVALATRVQPDKAAAVCAALPTLKYHEAAQLLSGNEENIQAPVCRGRVAIVTAGTSDIGVAEEAALTLQFLGHPADKVYDVGVAGLHRVLSQTPLLRAASVIIVVAGMEGALPSVVAGLVSCPVIGVPTSIGYGVAQGGFSALLGMLTSCAPGLGVVNIDNGFGAACLAATINTQ